jgi:hypothetical protein
MESLTLLWTFSVAEANGKNERARQSSAAAMLKILGCKPWLKTNPKRLKPLAAHLASQLARKRAFMPSRPLLFIATLPGG